MVVWIRDRNLLYDRRCVWWKKRMQYKQSLCGMVCESPVVYTVVWRSLLASSTDFSTWWAIINNTRMTKRPRILLSTLCLLPLCAGDRCVQPKMNNLKIKFVNKILTYVKKKNNNNTNLKSDRNIYIWIGEQIMQ